MSSEVIVRSTENEDRSKTEDDWSSDSHHVGYFKPVESAHSPFVRSQLEKTVCVASFDVSLNVVPEKRLLLLSNLLHIIPRPYFLN